MRLLALLILPLAACAAAVESVPADARYCGTPTRDESGRIKRSETAKQTFAKTWPCPSTGKRTASCPGWQIDHVIPLANGGCDLQFNMQWLPVGIKTCSSSDCKDRWERRVYATGAKK